VDACPASLTVARRVHRSLPGVARLVRRCSSLHLLVPTIPLMRCWGLLESRGKCRCWDLQDARHRLSVGCGQRGYSDGSAPAYAYALREFGHGKGVGVLVWV
jgi:hypothetical protein